MHTGFWLRRYGITLAVAFTVITGVTWMKGHALEVAARHGLQWAILSAACFVGGQVHAARRGRTCALCRVPEAGNPRA